MDDMDRHEYAAGDCVFCPHCRSNNTRLRTTCEFDGDGGTEMDVPKRCKDCGTTWEEIWLFNNIVAIQTPEPA